MWIFRRGKDGRKRSSVGCCHMVVAAESAASGAGSRSLLASVEQARCPTIFHPLSTARLAPEGYETTSVLGGELGLPSGFPQSAPVRLKSDMLRIRLSVG